jgi:hypothetical protein
MKDPSQSCAPSGPSSAVCPNCARLMPTMRVIPSFGTLPELHVYHCKDCGEALTQAIEPGECHRQLAA